MAHTLLRKLPRAESLTSIAKRVSVIDPTSLLAYVSLIIVAKNMIALNEVKFARLGLSNGRFGVLIMLYDHDTGLTPAELAENAAVSRGTITGLLQGLEQDGYVKRVARTDDRRMVTIQLTAAGSKLLDKILPEHFRRIAVLMKTLTKDEQRTLARLLEKVHSGIGALDD
ncbi:MAG: MarR family transcriptional regulator [Polyangiaceae bacterium]